MTSVLFLCWQKELCYDPYKGQVYGYHSSIAQRLSQKSKSKFCFAQCIKAFFTSFCSLQVSLAEDFKYNFFQQDLSRVKEHEARVQNVFLVKSQIEGHRIHQLGSLAKSARSRPNFLSCLADRFYETFNLGLKQNIF